MDTFAGNMALIPLADSENMRYTYNDGCRRHNNISSDCHTQLKR